jgi:hypothetical protein
MNNKKITVHKTNIWATDQLNLLISLSERGKRCKVYMSVGHLLSVEHVRGSCISVACLTVGVVQ